MTDPIFPPLLSGHRRDSASEVPAAALRGAAAHRYGAGDLVWAADSEHVALALVLEPEVARDRCGEMLYLGAVAFGDAAGAVIPPEVAITYSWPGGLRLNGALVGKAELVLPEGAGTAAPDWMVLTLDAALLPPRNRPEPGQEMDRTTFWDEGCGDMNTGALVESLSKHLVNWLHRWEDEGFRPVHEQWWGRRDTAAPLARGLAGDLTGLDEHGNALLRGGGGLKTLDQMPMAQPA